MAFHVWAWSGDGEPVITADAAGPGPLWQRVGEVDANDAPDLFVAVQRRLGLKSGRSPKAIRDYLTGDPRQAWIQEGNSASGEFYLALGPIGSTTLYLKTRLPVRAAEPKRRKPEPHPGLLMSPVYIGVEVVADDRGHFDRIDA